MRYQNILLALFLLVGSATAQEKPNSSQFYQVDVVEIGISADIELPEKLGESLEELEPLIKSGRVLCKESLRFSALGGRKTSVAFGASVNVVQGVVQYQGKSIKNYMHQPVGTSVDITLTPDEDGLISARLSYKATRVIGKPEGKQMTNFAHTQINVDTQVKLREPTVLVARSEVERRFIVLTVRETKNG